MSEHDTPAPWLQDEQAHVTHVPLEHHHIEVVDAHPAVVFSKFEGHLAPATGLVAHLEVPALEHSPSHWTSNHLEVARSQIA